MQNTPVDYSRKWFVMSSVAMGIFLSTIDGSIVNVALPTLVTELHTDFATVQWVVLGYLLVVTTLMLGVGRLADMIGKKPLYAIGFVIFTTGSVLCGLSQTITALIMFRLLQAVGAAMMMALGTAIITEAFPPEQRGMALGIGGLMVSMGIITGPTLGGIILQGLTWHWIFFVNLPLGIIGTSMVLRFVPHYKPEGGQRFDFAGAITLCVSMCCFLLAMTIGQNEGFLTPLVLGLFAGWGVFMAIFVWIERKIPQPMIDLSLFQNGLFSVNLVTGFLAFVANSGVILLMPFYLEGVLRYNPRTAGLLMGVFPLLLGISAPLSGKISDRIGTRPLTVIGLFSLAFGYWAVSSLGTDTSAWGYIVRFIPVGIGMGLFQSPNNSAVMGASPRNRLGVASGLLAITRTLGQTTGIAALGALWATRVVDYAGVAVEGGAPAASAAAQVAGLHDTTLVMVGLLVAAGLLSVWALLREKQVARSEV